MVTGYLLAPVEAAPPVRLRRIKAVLDPIPRFGPELVPLFRWLADYYQYPLGEALSHLIPGGARPAGGRRETWAAPVPEAEAPPLPPRLGPKARALLAYLRESGPAWAKDLQPHFPGCRPHPAPAGGPGPGAARPTPRLTRPSRKPAPDSRSTTSDPGAGAGRGPDGHY